MFCNRTSTEIARLAVCMYRSAENAETRDGKLGKAPKVQKNTFGRVKPIVPRFFRIRFRFESSNQIPIRKNLGTIGLTHPKVAFLVFAIFG